jgi:hypothetical protein
MKNHVKTKKVDSGKIDFICLERKNIKRAYKKSHLIRWLLNLVAGAGFEPTTFGL